MPHHSRCALSAAPAWRPFSFRSLAMVLLIFVLGGLLPASVAYPGFMDYARFSETTLLPSDLAPLDTFGSAVSISGHRALVGAPLHNAVGNDSGAAYVFHYSDSGWVQETILIPPGLAQLGHFGASVSIDRDTAVIGAPLQNEVGNNSGAAYVFYRNDSTWTLQATLTPSDLSPLDQFGRSVSISKDTIVIGSPFHNRVGDDSGAAYVFRRSGSSWTEDVELAALDLAPLDNFGASVWIDDNRVVVGAPLHNEAGNDSGAAYVFKRHYSTWKQEAKLTSSDLAPRDHFGESVSMSWDRAVVGSPLHNKVGDNSGAAYVFSRYDSTWIQTATLTASDLAPLDSFGHSVAIDGTTIAVGSPWHNEVGDDSGAAYLFHLYDYDWTQVARLTASDLSPLDHFGKAVDLSCETSLIGSPGRDAVGSNSGSAYVFPGSMLGSEYPIDGETCSKEPGSAPTPPDSPPDGGNGIIIIVDLLRTGPNAGGGIVVFRASAGGEQFGVKVEKLDPGTFDLTVGGVIQGQLDVSKKGKGEIAFESDPASDTDMIPLTFDPRGRMIEVSQGPEKFLAVEFPERPFDKKGRKIKIGINFTTTGALPDARGKFAFSTKKGRSFVKAQIRGVPPGEYPLRVGGIEVGTMQVEGKKGKLEFDSEAATNKQLLTFDPRGKSVEILKSGVVILEADCPLTPAP